MNNILKVRGDNVPKLIDRLLGLDKIREGQRKNYEMLNTGFSGFSQFTGDAYQNDVYRSAVDSIARHIAKLSGKHVVDNQNEANRYSKLNRILQDRPNPYMCRTFCIKSQRNIFYLTMRSYLYKRIAGATYRVYSL